VPAPEPSSPAAAVVGGGDDGVTVTMGRQGPANGANGAAGGGAATR
jgi:hypothetical protein